MNTQHNKQPANSVYGSFMAVNPLTEAMNRGTKARSNRTTQNRRRHDPNGVRCWLVSACLDVYDVWTNTYCDGTAVGRRFPRGLQWHRQKDR